jgi:hypothetical protein
MPRRSERKTTPSLENLETRNLQSALGAGASVAAVRPAGPTSALISPEQLQSNPGLHGYHQLGGFFGR